MPKPKEIALGLCGFILPHGPAIGEVRPAVIVKALSGTRAALQVFTAPGDGLPNVWPAEAEYDAAQGLGTWHELKGRAK